MVVRVAPPGLEVWYHCLVPLFGTTVWDHITWFGMEAIHSVFFLVIEWLLQESCNGAGGCTFFGRAPCHMEYVEDLGHSVEGGPL